MPRRRRSNRRRDGAVTLLILLVLAIILLIMVTDGRLADLEMPGFVDLPDIALPNIEMPITGLPEIEIPAFRVPVTVEPGDLVPDIRIGGTLVPDGSHLLAPQAKTSGCQLQGSLPDPGCTPGAVTDAAQEQVCDPGYASTVQEAPAAQSEAVFGMYGIGEPERGQYQIDYLVPLVLGGSNDSANLWPQPAGSQPGASQKNAFEDYLRDQVCAGEITLEAAQTQIAENWLAGYYRMP